MQGIGHCDLLTEREHRGSARESSLGIPRLLECPYYPALPKNAAKVVIKSLFCW